MDSALWTASLLLGAVLLCAACLVARLLRPAPQAALPDLPAAQAQKIFRRKLGFRLAALAAFLAGAAFWMLGGQRILCLIFVVVGFACQYGVYRLRCQFPAAAQQKL